MPSLMPHYTLCGRQHKNYIRRMPQLQTVLSGKESNLWPGQLPGSLALAMAIQAQIARRKERTIGLLLLAASTFILELMPAKMLE